MKPGWTTVALGEVAEVVRRTVSPADMQAEERYLGLEHIERGGRILGGMTVGEAGPRSNKFRFDAGQILYGKLRPNLGKIARPKFSGLCSTDILPLRVNEDVASPEFVLHFLSQPDVINHVASRATGANLPRISAVELKKVGVPLPSLEEQRRIAAMLDSVSTTYRRVQTIGPRLQAAERAVVSRAPWGPGRWSTIGESLKLQSGATLPATRRIPGGVPVYGANGVIGEHDQTTHDAARVTIGRVGAVGAVNITSGPAWISDNALIVKEAPGHVTNAYLSHALTLADLGRYASQSAQPLITQSKIAEAPLWIPSPGEAARMQETLMRLEKMRGVAVEHENRAQALFASLQSRAFRGEL